MVVGKPAGLRQAVQDPHDTRAGQRDIDLDRRAGTGEVVDDIERAEPPTAGQHVVLEIHRPALARRLRHGQGLAFALVDALSLAFPHLQALLDVNPVHRLVIDTPRQRPLANS